MNSLSFVKYFYAIYIIKMFDWMITIYLDVLGLWLWLAFCDFEYFVILRILLSSVK